MLAGMVAEPVSAVTTIDELTPTLRLATAKSPMPATPGMLMIPPCVGVAPMATMSGVGVADEVSRTVLMPSISPAEAPSSPANRSTTSVCSKRPVGVIATR